MTRHQEYIEDPTPLQKDAVEYLNDMAVLARENAVIEAHRAAVLDGRSPSALGRSDIDEGFRQRAIRNHQQVRTIVGMQLASLLVMFALGGVCLLVVVAISTRGGSVDATSSYLPLLVVAMTSAGVVFSSRLLFSGGRSRASMRASAATERLVNPPPAEYLVAWDSLERRMRAAATTNQDDYEDTSLAEVIAEVSRRFSIDPEEIRSLLRTRNAIAHGTHKVSASAIQEGVARIDHLARVVRSGKKSL